MKKIVFGLLWCSCLGAMGQQPVANSFRLPLDMSPQISGSFAEIRPNHFHSGIDFATGGKSGDPIHAIADGYVSRIKIQSGGYGKALYITHRNGYTSVYGHLNGFSSRIDSIVIACHYRRQQFEIDEYFSPEEMPLTQGEVIGFVGNSGSSSGPHLHFEIRRTSDEKTIDPLLFIRNVNDQTPPAITGIRLYPISDDAGIGGKHQTQTYKTVLASGVYRIVGNPTIAAGGTIGVGIESVDYFTGSWRKCGIYSVTMSLNGKSLFKSEFDEFSFDQTRYVNSYIDYAFKMATGRVFQKCYVDPYNHLDVYPVKVNNGLFEVEEGEINLLEVKVADSYGNVSVLQMNVKGAKPLSSKSTITNIKGDKALVIEKENIKVNIPDDCFYTDVPFDVSEHTNSGGEKYYSIGSRNIPMQQYVSLSVKIPASKSLYSRYLCLANVSGGKTSYAGGVVQGGWINARIREAGDYKVAVDSIAPTASVINAAPSLNYSGRKTLELSVKDNFSGISSFRGEIDGNWVLLEYDGKFNRFICPLSRINLTRNKKHVLKLVVVDGVGNEVNKTINFTY